MSNVFTFWRLRLTATNYANCVWISCVLRRFFTQFAFMAFFVRMTSEKFHTYLQIARAIATDELYNMIFANLSFANNLLEAFTEEEVERFLCMCDLSNDRKLEMISVWAESKTDMFYEPDSLFDVFTSFLRHINATKLSRSAIITFLCSESLFAMNLDCR